MYTVVVFISIFSFYFIYILFISFGTFVQTGISTQIRNWADKKIVNFIQAVTALYDSLLGFRKKHYLTGYVQDTHGFICERIFTTTMVKSIFRSEQPAYSEKAKDNKKVSRYLKKFNKLE